MSELFDGIQVRGAREHNLKNVNVDIPRNKITVITGLSGSGKSSLAFDTIYAEGQRRYIESFSAYARNFMEQLKRPNVDSIIGLSPSIAIDQKTNVSNPRSTVGTVTEIYDYLRLLFARIGKPYCPKCDILISSQSVEEISSEIWSLPDGAKLALLAPVVQGQKGEFRAEITGWIKKGWTKARIDHSFCDLSHIEKLAKTKTHDIDLVILRFQKKESLRQRVYDSIRAALSLSQGYLTVLDGSQTEKRYSTHSSCPKCKFSYPPIEPRLFSFNNPRGSCLRCAGLGYIGEESEDFDVDETDESTSQSKSPSNERCPSCLGTRLRPEALSVKLDSWNVHTLSELPATALIRELQGISLTEREELIAQKILQQIHMRLNYMQTVGVGYLSLNRMTRTLSGGEAQRIRLATQVGSSLVGVLYVLDEPSIGLHPRDHKKLLDVIKSIRDLGNSILIVEHDEETIRSADFVLDLGPGAGAQGGSITARGSVSDLISNKNSLTGDYLSGRRTIALPKQRRTPDFQRSLRLYGARSNNLKSVHLTIPVGLFTCVTGVSGSGKSTLIIDTLFRVIHNHLYKSALSPGLYDRIEGLELVDHIVDINQSPIGRTPRSNPATYVGLFSAIRQLFSQHPESRMRGYAPGRFSFNVKGGRCESCQGGGAVRVEMHFLSDVFVTCDTCLGKKYNRETLSVKYRDKSIFDVLDMSVAEALDFFKNHKVIHNKLKTLHQVGLDYVRLGQSSTTLSGGEAQRIKLSRELSKRSTGKTLYILDEPTTGLHFADIAKLIELLQKLVDQGNTVVVIEHNVDVIKSADHLIDLGPEGGDAGGEILDFGSPEKIAMNPQSPTGQVLRPVLI